MSRLLMALTIVALAGCPAPEQLEDAGPRDSGTSTVDAGVASCEGLGGSSPPDGGMTLDPTDGIATFAQDRCWEQGEQWTVTFPPRTVAKLVVDTTGGLRVVVSRGAEVLYDETPNSPRTGWVVSGNSNITLRVSHAGTSTTVRVANISFLRTNLAESGGWGALVDGGRDFDTRPASTLPATAPVTLWGDSPYYRFNLGDAHARAADLPGCTHPASAAPSYYAFALDAGAWDLNNVGIPVNPDFFARVVDLDGGLLAEGVLGATLPFTLTAPTTIAFGFQALDAGVVNTCAFDGGVMPDFLLAPQREVVVMAR